MFGSKDANNLDLSLDEDGRYLDIATVGIEAAPLVTARGQKDDETSQLENNK